MLSGSVRVCPTELCTFGLKALALLVIRYGRTPKLLLVWLILLEDLMTLILFHLRASTYW